MKAASLCSALSQLQTIDVTWLFTVSAPASHQVPKKKQSPHLLLPFLLSFPQPSLQRPQIHALAPLPNSPNLQPAIPKNPTRKKVRRSNHPHPRLHRITENLQHTSQILRRAACDAYPVRIPLFFSRRRVPSPRIRDRWRTSRGSDVKARHPSRDLFSERLVPWTWAIEQAGDGDVWVRERCS